MQYLVIDSQSIALLLTAAITFTIGTFAGFQIARLRLSEVEFCRMQLRRVFRAPFQKQKLMNFSEFQVFRIIEQDAEIRRAGFRLVAQAPLGEILKSQHKNGFRAVNGKRIDMLILDRAGWPLLAIEYQGEGHYDDTSDLRDAIKKTALTKAGIGYLEIFPKDKGDAARIRSLVHERLGLTMPVRETVSSSPRSNIRVLHP
ncbi:MAG TPA: DUF2726 domain-containing protein [Rhizomicrobium sp.]|jgi:hypothetical protein